MAEKRQDWKERQEASDGIIEGRNAVTEALRAGTPIDKVYLARGETDAALGHIAAKARERGIAVVDCDRRCLLYTSPSPRDRCLSRMPSSA